MRKNSLFLIAVLGYVASFGQTTVSGFISSNTTWNLAGSPYIVTGNTLLSNGCTLTIDPGVIIKFDTDKALQIDGQLIAIGTPTQRITFTSNQASPMPGDWAKLHFSNLSTDAVFDTNGNYLSGSIMKNCDIKYAGSLGYSAIDIQQSSPYINKCNITLSAASGIIYNSMEKAVIDSSSIKNCAEYGILFKTPYYFMQSDSIIANLLGGIQMWSSGLQAKVLNSYFEYNNTAISWQFNGIQSTTISGNTFANNTGITVNLQGHFDTVVCNKFINNTGGPALFMGGASNPICGGVIFNNLFDGNSNSSSNAILEIGAGYYGGSGDTLIFANNIFRNNSVPGGSCIIFDPYLTNFSLIEYLRVYDNSFTNNIGSNLIKITGPQNSDASYNFLYMKNNIFVNPNCQYEFYNDIPYGSPNLFLDNNYWGSTSSSHIDSVIYDYFDYANQSVVYYSPFLNSPIIIDSTCRHFVDMPVGLNDYFDQIKMTFLIYPNPFSTQTNIQTDNYLHNATIIVTNSFGQIVKQMQNISGETITISRDNLYAGLYFFRLTEENKVMITGKFIITDR